MISVENGSKSEPKCSVLFIWNLCFKLIIHYIVNFNSCATTTILDSTINCSVILTYRESFNYLFIRTYLCIFIYKSSLV